MRAEPVTFSFYNMVKFVLTTFTPLVSPTLTPHPSPPPPTKKRGYPL